MPTSRKIAPTPVQQVNAYIAARPPLVRKRLAELRAAIKAAAPTATPGFGYGIPGFRLDDRVLVYYAAFTAHVSIYPISREFERANAILLQDYATSGKGTLRFPLDAPIPRGLVKRVVLDRVRSVKAKAKKRR